MYNQLNFCLQTNFASTYYCIVFLYSKYVCFYVFMPNKLFNFFRNMFNSNTVKKIISIFFTYKLIQCVPTSAHSSRFITYAPSFILLGKIMLRINSIESRFILHCLMAFVMISRSCLNTLMEQLFLCFLQNYLYH